MFIISYSNIWIDLFSYDGWNTSIYLLKLQLEYYKVIIKKICSKAIVLIQLSKIEEIRFYMRSERVVSKS